MFSLGYGDDDDKEGDVLTVPLGMGRLVGAVDEVRNAFLFFVLVLCSVYCVVWVFDCLPSV